MSHISLPPLVVLDACKKYYDGVHRNIDELHEEEIHRNQTKKTFRKRMTTREEAERMISTSPSDHYRIRMRMLKDDKKRVGTLSKLACAVTYGGGNEVIVDDEAINLIFPFL